MDKHRVVAILIGLAVFTAPRLCSARIGETLGECEIRYGVMLKVISHSWPDYPEYCFKLGDCEIRVRLYKGVSAQEAFHIPGRMLTNYQVQEILRKNGAGSEKITSNHFTINRSYNTCHGNNTCNHKLVRYYSRHSSDAWREIVTFMSLLYN